MQKTKATGQTCGFCYFKRKDLCMLLSAEQVSKSYGDNQVLNQVSLTLQDGQKLGLVGANGVGKSTLLKIIVGEIEADSGKVTLAQGIRLGYLPQVLHNADELTVDELIQ